MSDNGSPSVRDAARDYLRRGWYPVPIPAGTKKPVLKAWPKLRLHAEEIPDRFQPNDNIGLILGEPSGWLVNVDLDCDEARELADQYLPSTPAVTGRPSAPRSHRWYVAENVTTKKHQDPINRSMIVELRSTGTQTVVGPSVHPSGERYGMLEGEPAHLSGPMLAACVSALADAVVKRRYPDRPNQTPQQNLPPPETRFAGNPSDVERRAIAYLDTLPSAVSGQGGHSATYTAAVALVHGFCIEPERALLILLECYNPRCEPAWTEKELAHKVNDAATKPHDKPYGWLRDAPLPERIENPAVDVSAIVEKARVRDGDETATEEHSDPGPIPEQLLRVPGFIDEVMAFTRANAPYPNVALAFCGALALQSYLCGRKVCDAGDLRPNIYLLALASSGTGKDFPRKVNSRVLFEIGHVAALGDKFASGEGIQDALIRTNAMLFQNDEMDGVLRQINLDRENKRESIPNILLTLYTSASDVYPIRSRASQKDSLHIDQPHLTLYGTATPQYFYESLSHRMLTNGFFARMIIIDVGKRGEGQSPGSTRNLPEPILQTARWWADFQPGKTRKNLLEVHPEPRIVPATPDAESAIANLQRLADVEYDRAHQRGDEVSRVAWSRTCENAKKLALLYACSANHEDPRIELPAVEWATRFAMHQTRRQLYLAQIYVAENPFHAECLKLMRKLQEADGQMARNKLMRAMRCKMQDFDQIVGTLITQGDIVPVEIPTKTKTALGYRIA